MSTDIAELTRRVQRLEAIREIEQLKYRYWRACDRKDPVAFRECFVRHGADLDYGVLGKFSDREPLVEVFERIGCATTEKKAWLVHDIHHGLQPVIEVLDEHTATGEWTLWFVQINNQDKTITQLSMEYRDTYVIEDGRWKVAKSYVTPMTTLSLPFPDSGFTSSLPLR
ncbi:nuclear transport factor 2 family protein [Solimonas soli]|uniref:nuclear transport factor 2 family protein n=1 Tax=Solimonas soli TaxID=413479 RepID=UPI00047F9BFE|nr:nuclear transport factor 2 family protein [Solimonas soli]